MSLTEVPYGLSERSMPLGVAFLLACPAFPGTTITVTRDAIPERKTAQRVAGGMGSDLVAGGGGLHSVAGTGCDQGALEGSCHVSALVASLDEEVTKLMHQASIHSWNLRGGITL